ncbi:MAG TPA: pyruvate, phosphate dikinase, partial [Candidatus Omnitrophota bacterium]|nr:pyruvate, phosphate dikinase [Candidatus Omnitrophota bacterium]
PVSFAEIDRVSILCEVAAMHENLIPEVSLGTHFFNDLVEMDMLYLAVYPQRKDNIINDLAFSKARNILTDLLPDAAPWASVVHVIDSSGTKQEHSILLHADVLQQNAICYFS